MKTAHQHRLLPSLICFSSFLDYQAKRQSSKKSQAPIYEEMVGVKSPTRKLPPNMLEEAESCEYKNYQLKKSCPENHYESPSGALFPRHDSQKWTTWPFLRHHEHANPTSSSFSRLERFLTSPYTPFVRRFTAVMYKKEMELASIVVVSAGEKLESNGNQCTSTTRYICIL